MNNLIRLLSDRIESLAERITIDVKEKTPAYFQSFKSIVNKPFLENDSKNSIKIHSDLNEESKFKDNGFNEKFSDLCYSLLLNENNNKCGTSNQCFQFFTDQSASDYYLTHQLIYFMLVKHVSLK